MLYEKYDLTLPSAVCCAQSQGETSSVVFVDLIYKVQKFTNSPTCQLDWYVTLDHKTSLTSLGYICSNSQKYTVGQNYRFFFYAKNH